MPDSSRSRRRRLSSRFIERSNTSRPALKHALHCYPRESNWDISMCNFIAIKFPLFYFRHNKKQQIYYLKINEQLTLVIRCLSKPKKTIQNNNGMIITDLVTCPHGHCCRGLPLNKEILHCPGAGGKLWVQPWGFTEQCN